MCHLQEFVIHHYLVKILAHWKLHGPFATAVSITVAALGKLRIPLASSAWFESYLEHHFEKRFGVNTRNSELEGSRVELPGSVSCHSAGYGPTPAIELFQLLHSLSFEEETTFVDVGCGKGKAMLVAALFPFARIEGVELSANLAQRCEKNLAERTYPRIIPPCNVVCEDARDYQFPKTDLVVFLFNPFDDVIMNSMLDNLTKSLERNPRRVTIVYCNALHRACFERTGCWHALHIAFPVKDWWACYEYKNVGE